MMTKQEQFELYTRELISWNEKINLTSITTPEDIGNKHFYDSLTLLKAYDFSQKGLSVIDIGAGGGFPGIPLKIEHENIHLTLLDSVKKKITFLEHLVSALELTDTKAVWSRAEDYALQKKDSFDVAVARALAPLNIAAELSLPFVKPGGVFLAMKSKEAENEADTAQYAIKKLGGRIENILDVSPNDGSMVRKIVIIQKISVTPAGFPRKAGTAGKQPL